MNEITVMIVLVVALFTWMKLSNLIANVLNGKCVNHWIVSAVYVITMLGGCGLIAAAFMYVMTYDPT